MAKKFQINIEPGKPLRIINEEEESADNTRMLDSKIIGTTLKAYQKAMIKLVNEKYINQKDLIPVHLKSPCSIWVFICTDGVFVRYDELLEGESIVRTAIIEKKLSEIAPVFSDAVLHFPDNFSEYLPEQRGPNIIITKNNIERPITEGEEIVRFIYEVYAKSNLPDTYIIEPPPNRPAKLVSLINEIIFNLEGELSSAEIAKNSVNNVDRFITFSILKLNVGWLAIDVFPLLPLDCWNPEYSALWAELDLLALLAQKNILKDHLNNIDSRGETRKYYSCLLKEFEILLKGLEEPLHQFLKLHPELLCPSHETCWSKVRFGQTISDFVFREVYNDYLLVEIEAPIRELFRRDGQQRQELTHAINQITDWVQFIQYNKKTVENELGLVGISTNPRVLVVIGRSASLTEDNRRKIETLQAQQNKLRIMTYDDVLLNAKESLGRILGNLDIYGDNTEVYFFKK